MSQKLQLVRFRSDNIPLLGIGGIKKGTIDVEDKRSQHIKLERDGEIIRVIGAPLGDFAFHISKVEYWMPMKGEAEKDNHPALFKTVVDEIRAFRDELIGRIDKQIEKEPAKAQPAPEVKPDPKPTLRGRLSKKTTKKGK